jgi:hypothetical protein
MEVNMKMAFFLACAILYEYYLSISGHVIPRTDTLTEEMSLCVQRHLRCDDFGHHRIDFLDITHRPVQKVNFINIPSSQTFISYPLACSKRNSNTLMMTQPRTCFRHSTVW